MENLQASRLGEAYDPFNDPILGNPFPFFAPMPRSRVAAWRNGKGTCAN